MAESDPRDQRIAQLERQLAEAIAQLAEVIAQNAELKARLRMSSANSSKPPSSDPPWTQRPGKTPSGRKPGGQPGHKRSMRPLVPPERVDHIKDHYPQACARCEASLEAAPEVGEPLQHQVAELPEIRAVVTEHRCHARQCACGHLTIAPLPADVPRGAFGPRLLATLAILSGRYRQSRREVAAIFDAVFNIKLSTGMVDKACQLGGTLMKPAVDEVAQALASAAVTNADETSFRCAGEKGWLWVATCVEFTLFRLVPGRGAEFARQLLNGFTGILGSDRYAGYGWFDTDHRQLCWAHLKRNLKALVDSGGNGASFGQAGLLIIKEMFELWHLHKDSADRTQLGAEMASLQGRWRVLREIHDDSPCSKVRGMVRDFDQYWNALWTFVVTPGVEPTNNAAERAIRPAVLWRKGSFGTQSPGGVAFVEGILTVSATCAQRRRSVYEYLIDLFSAHIAHEATPSLLNGP